MNDIKILFVKKVKFSHLLDLNVQLTILLFLISLSLYSQEFEKGDIDINTGVGFGLYGTTTNDASDTSQTSGVGAAAGLIPVTIHYSLTDHLGVGIYLERNGFVTEDDSSSTDIVAHSLNIGAEGIIRFMKMGANSANINILIGYSGLVFKDNMSKERIDGGGLNIQAGICLTHLFGEHVGLFLQSAFASYKYNRLYNQNNDLLTFNNGKSKLELGLIGANIRIGLTFKI